MYSNVKMRLCTIFLLTFVISLTCVFTAPLEKRNPDPDGTGAATTSTSTAKNAAGKFAKFADQYVKPIWLSNKGPKGTNKSKKKKKNKKNKDGSANGKERSRSRTSNKNKQKRLDGFKLAFIVPLYELIGDFHEDSNVEDEMKIIMTWWNDDDDNQVVLIEPVNTLSLNESNKNQLTREKRDNTRQISSSKFEPPKKTLITPNEDITELGYYRNNKLDSILKKLENNDIIGRNQFENKESLWKESQVEENSFYSDENAEEDIKTLELEITGATSNSYDNVKKNEGDRGGESVNTKSGVSSNQSSNYTPNFEDFENDPIINKNLQSNLKQNELSNKDSKESIKQLPKQREQHNYNPKIKAINFKPSNTNHPTNTILENQNDELNFEGDKNSGESFSNVSKKKKINEPKPKFDDFMNDSSLETEEISQENPIFNDIETNRLKNIINNKNHLTKNIPKTLESIESNSIPVTKNEANNPISHGLKDHGAQNNSNNLGQPDRKISNELKKELSLQNRKTPSVSATSVPTFNQNNQLVSTPNSMDLTNPDDDANDFSLETEELSIEIPIYKNVREDKSQNKMNSAKLPNILENSGSVDASKNNELSKTDQQHKLKNSNSNNKTLVKQSPKIVSMSNKSEIDKVPKKPFNKPIINQNPNSSDGSINSSDLNELMNKEMSTQHPDNTNESSHVTKENPIFKEGNDNEFKDTIYAISEKPIILKSMEPSKVSMQPKNSHTNTEISSNMESPSSKPNLTDKNGTFESRNPEIDDINTLIQSQVDRSDSLKDKVFLNSIEYSSDELEGAIILSTGSFSSSKDQKKQKSSQIDRRTPENNINNFSNSPVIEDIIKHGDSKIKTDQNLEKLKTIDPKIIEPAVNDDDNEDIINTFNLNSEEGQQINDAVNGKLSEANDVSVNDSMYGDNSKVSKKKINNDINNEHNKIQQSNNEIEDIGSKYFETLPFNDDLKAIGEQILQSTNDKQNRDTIKKQIISHPKTDKPMIEVNSNPNNVLSQNISPRLPNFELKATEEEMQNSFDENPSKPNYSSNKYISSINNDPLDSLGGESFFDTIEHLPSSVLENALKSENVNLINNHNQKPMTNEYTIENNTPTSKLKEIESEPSKNSLNIDNDELNNQIEEISNAVDEPLISSDQLNSEGFDLFNSLKDKSILISKERISNNLPITENYPFKIQQMKKPKTDEKSQNVSDMTTDEHNFKTNNEGITNPTDDKKHTNDDLHSLNQLSSRNPLDTPKGTSFFNPFKELSNKLLGEPMNKDLVLNNDNNEKLDTNENNQTLLGMDTNKSILSEKDNKVHNVLRPENNEPTMSADFSSSTIDSRNTSPRQSSELKSTDGNILTPYDDDTGKPNYSSNKYMSSINNDLLDSLGGESFFDTIEHLPSSGLENAPKSGNVNLINNHNQKPMTNGYTMENTTPTSKQKETISDPSKNNLNIDNDELNNQIEEISNAVDKPLFSSNQLNSKGFDPFNSLEDKSFLISNEAVLNEPPNVPIIKHSIVNDSHSEKDKSYEPKILPNFSKNVPLTSKIPNTLNNAKTSEEKNKRKPEVPHILNSITNYDPDLSNINENYGSVVENNSHQNPMDSVNSKDSHQDFFKKDSSLSIAFEDLTDGNLDAGKGDLSEIFNMLHKVPNNSETNANQVLKAELKDHTNNNSGKSTKESINKTSLKPKSQESSSELINSALNTFDSEEQRHFDNNIQLKTNKPKSSEELTPNQFDDPFNSLDDATFFNPINNIPSNEKQSLSKSENNISMNDNNPQIIIKDTTKGTEYKPKLQDILSRPSTNELDSINGKTNNPFGSVKDQTNKPAHIKDQLTSKQSHDTFDSLEDKSLPFPNETFSEEQQNESIVDDSFLKKNQNKLPATSKKTNDLPEIVSNVLNAHSKPLNKPIDGVKKTKDVKHNVGNNFDEHFMGSKSDIDLGNISDLFDNTDITKNPNKYLEKINEIIHNTSMPNTKLKPQSQPNTSSNAEKKQKTIIFSPNASNHQHTNIFKNPETNQVPSVSGSGLSTNNLKQIVNDRVTPFSSFQHEKPEPAVDLYGQKSGYNLNGLVSNPIKNVHDYLSNDNKDGKLYDNTLSETIPVNNGKISYVTDQPSNQLSKEPPAQHTKESNHQNVYNPNTSILNVANHMKIPNSPEQITPKIQSDTSLVVNNKSKNYPPGIIENSYSDEKSRIHRESNKAIHNLDASMISPTVTSKKQNYNPYGYMIPKFRTKYEGGSSNDLWESIPPKQIKNFNLNSGLDQFNNIPKVNKVLNENSDPDNIISSHVNNKGLNTWNENKKNNNEQSTHGNLDTNNNNQLINEYIKSLTEKLLNRMDDIDDKMSNLNHFSSSLIGNQRVDDNKTDDPKNTKYFSTNTNPKSSRNKNKKKELESKENESVEKLDGSDSDDKSRNEENKKIKNEKRKREKRRKHKEDTSENDDLMYEKYRNYEKNKNKNHHKKHNNNSNNSSNDSSNVIKVDKNHRKIFKTDSSNDSEDLAIKKRHKKSNKNYLKYSDDENSQQKNGAKRTKNNKKKKITYSSEDDSKINYSSSIGISEENYESERDFKANNSLEKSKTTKTTKNKLMHKSHTTHPKRLKESTSTKSSIRKKHLKDDSSYDKTVVSSKKHGKVNSEDDEVREPKKKKKRKKKKKIKKNTNTKNVKETDTQATDNDSKDNTSEEYEYVTFHPIIQYRNPLSRLITAWQ